MSETMDSRKRLGIPDALYALPITVPLRTMNGLQVVEDAPARNAIRLREHNIDAALLSPIDFAKDGSSYRIVQGVAASSRSANSAITLHFREGLHEISAIAVDPALTSEIVLAKIVLAEEFDISPRIIPLQGPLDVLLGKADAALLAGDSSLREATVHHNVVDLVETWSEMTDLPFVHCFWCSRKEDLTEVEVRSLQEAQSEGVSMFDEIAAQAATHSRFPVPTASLKGYLDTFSYDFADDAQEGLKEFLRYAYYHGILPDVPDIQWFGADGEED
jgi:chorismate dehydratase